MSNRYHGVSDTTFQRLIFDSGKVYRDFVSTTNPGTCIGATRGGSSFTLATEIKEMAVDGQKGPVKGGRRITKVVAKMKLNFLEVSKDLLLDSIPGSAVTGTTTFSPDHVEIRRELELADANYLGNIVILAQMSGAPGNPIGFGIENALSDGSFEMSFVDNEEAVLAVEFTAHFDVADLDREPWFIIYPSDLTTTMAP